MNIKVSRKSLYYVILFPFFIYLMLNIDWLSFTQLKNESDVFSYIYGIDSGSYQSRLDEISIGDFLSSMLREPLWGIIVLALNNFFNSNLIFTIIIPLFILFSFSFYIYFNSKPIYVLALIHPIALVFYFNQLRLALAVAIFLFLWTIISNKMKVLLASTITFFIHTSLFIFLLVFYVCLVVSRNKKLANFKKLFLFTALGLILAYLTGPAISDVLGSLGDRRADGYSGTQWQISFVTILYCMSLLVIFYFNYYSSNMVISFESSVSVVFLSLVVFSYLFVGGYPFRFLSAIFPIIIVGGCHLILLYRILYFSILLVVGLYIGFVDLNWGLFFI